MTSPIQTYAELCTEVADYLGRRDLTAKIPSFIWQAHAKFNRELRVRDMQVRASSTTDGDYIPVPGDYLAPYSLELATQPGCWSAPLTFISEEQAREYRARTRNAGGALHYYTLFGSTFELIPAQGSDVDFQLKYYAQIPAMSAAGDSNWLLLKSPDLYVVSSCLEAMPYLEHDERTPTWATFRQQIIDAMNLESERALKPQAALNARTRSFG